MSLSFMRYREALPPLDLLRFVLAYWEFAVPESMPRPFIHHVFPDGCALLSYCVKSKRRASRMRAVGPTLQSRLIPT